MFFCEDLPIPNVIMCSIVFNVHYCEPGSFHFVLMLPKTILIILKIFFVNNNWSIVSKNLSRYI